MLGLDAGRPERSLGQVVTAVTRHEEEHVIEKRTGMARLAAGLAAVVLVVAACSSGGASAPPSAAAPSAAPTTAASAAAPSAAASAAASPAAAATCQGAGDKGEVKLMINQWVGAAANVAVVECLLKQIGYSVKTDTLAEEVAWQGFDTGEVDVILENWGHPDLEKTYITDKKVAQDAGVNGITGLIHWYVPPWLAKEHPDVLDWNNLNKYAANFKTTESGDQGQFLASDPTFVQEDRAIIDNLDLNFKVVDSGSEAASIAAFRQAEAQKQWLIGYFYDPQWLLAELALVQVKLPPYSDECYGDYSAAARAKIACDYPEYALNKIVSTKFAESGGDAYTLVKNFQWKNADQNAVAYSITEEKLSPEDAAKKWLDANPTVWQAWMPS
jgi:glycine betaine/proline transport system substrate-binding protein